MDKWLYRASIVFTLIGLAAAIYTSIMKVTGSTTMCIGNGGCLVTLNSPYGQIYGIPVAFIGVAGYLAILAVLILEKKAGTFFKQNASMITFGMVLLGFLFTLYLIYLEIFVIKDLCPFCVTSQVAMTFLFILSVIRLIKQPLD